MILKSKILNHKSKLGFTLIEILVVISIIGILATLILARLGGVEKSGRDARRKSDLNQYRTALENYAIKTNGLYPSYTTAGNVTGNICGKLVSSYLATCLTDPREDATYYYHYLSNGSSGGGDTASIYVVWATIETGATSTTINYVCSNGKIGQKTSAPTVGSGNDCQ
jgi:prepilin-type N-terminal cleavage/methylation domain-containing protein